MFSLYESHQTWKWKNNKHYYNIIYYITWLVFLCRFNGTDTNIVLAEATLLVCTAHKNTGTKTGFYLIMISDPVNGKLQEQTLAYRQTTFSNISPDLKEETSGKNFRRFVAFYLVPRTFIFANLFNVSKSRNIFMQKLWKLTFPKSLRPQKNFFPSFSNHKIT